MKTAFTRALPKLRPSRKFSRITQIKTKSIAVRNASGGRHSINLNELTHQGLSVLICVIRENFG